jgi:hypothetical protein
MKFLLILTSINQIPVAIYTYIYITGCDSMVVGFTTTYAISAYHH